MRGINKKRIFVAGGKGLIGKAIVKELQYYGASVIVADPEISSELWRLRHERFDGYVNATYPKRNHILLFTTTATMFCEHMAKFGGGSVVNLASIYGIVGPDDRLYNDTNMSMPSGYAAAKGAIIAHSKCIAARFGPRNVRVNCVSPGGVIADQPKKFVSAYQGKVPLRRMACAEDVCGMVAFLLSDSAKYITGQNIIIDGGLCASV